MFVAPDITSAWPDTWLFVRNAVAGGAAAAAAAAAAGTGTAAAAAGRFMSSCADVTLANRKKCGNRQNVAVGSSQLNFTYGPCVACIYTIVLCDNVDSIGRVAPILLEPHLRPS